MINRRQGIFDEYRWIISRLQWLLDGVVVVLLLLLICWICGESFRLIFQLLGLVAFLLTIMVFRATQLYQPWRGANLMRLVRRVFLAWLVVVAILMMLGYVSKTSVHLFPEGPPHLDGDSPRGPGGSASAGLLGLAMAAAAGPQHPHRGYCRGRGPGTPPGEKRGGHSLAGDAPPGVFRRPGHGGSPPESPGLSGAGHPGRHDRVRSERTGCHGLSGLAPAGRRPPPGRWWNLSGTPPPPSIMCRTSSFSPCSPPA